MYKITLYDYNCNPIYDGVACLFVNELEEFEPLWLARERDEERKKRYLRSKEGELVTDYYSDNSELNIVQFDENVEILGETKYKFKEKTYTLFNTYRWPSVIYARRTEITLRYIQFKGKYFLIGKYKLVGVCSEDHIHGENGNGWCYCSTWGNPIHNKSINDEDFRIDEDGLHRYDWPKDKFSNDFIETYCWVTIGVFSEKDNFDIDEMDNLSDEMIEILIRDIPGEAG